jgi:hypothetical protein
MSRINYETLPDEKRIEFPRMVAQHVRDVHTVANDISRQRILSPSSMHDIGQSIYRAFASEGERLEGYTFTCYLKDFDDYVANATRESDQPAYELAQTMEFVEQRRQRERERERRIRCLPFWLILYTLLLLSGFVMSLTGSGLLIDGLITDSFQTIFMGVQLFVIGLGIVMLAWAGSLRGLWFEEVGISFRQKCRIIWNILRGRREYGENPGTVMLLNGNLEGH